MYGWVDIAAVTMEKSGCGLMKLHGNSKIGFWGCRITMVKCKPISPSILISLAIGMMTPHLKKNHFYVLGTKVSENIHINYVQNVSQIYLQLARPGGCPSMVTVTSLLLRRNPGKLLRYIANP